MGAEWMKTVSNELFRAIVAVQKVDDLQGQSTPAASLTKKMDINFPGRSYHLLRVLSKAFAQSETDFASMILSHALSETLKILPDILSDEDFAKVEDRIIGSLGLPAYLRLQPVFPFQKGLLIPNYAEVATREGVYFGEWKFNEESVSVVDLASRTTLGNFEIKSKPEVSFDGITLQWKGCNVKPLYGEVQETDSFIGALQSADLLIIGDAGYLFKQDEYTDDLIFAPFANFSESNILENPSFKENFKVTDISGSFTVEPLSTAFSNAQKHDANTWICGGVLLRAIAVNNVIVSPEE